MKTKLTNDKLLFDPAHIVFKILYKDVNQFLKKRKKAFIAIILSLIGVLITIVAHKYELFAVFTIIFLISLFLFFSIKFKVKIKKIGTVFLPISIYPFKNKTIVVDRSGILPSTNFNYPYLSSENIENANNIYKNLKILSTRLTPVLNIDNQKQLKLSNNRVYRQPLKIYGQELTLITFLEKLLEIIKSAKVNRVDQSFIHSGINLIPALRKIALNNNNGLIIENVLKKDIKNEIDRIKGVLVGRHSENGEINIDKIVESILKFLSYMVPRYHWSISHSIKDVEAKNLFNFMNYISFNSFNFYCPQCNKELLKQLHMRNSQFTGKTEEIPINFPPTTKMRLIDVENNTWECPLCKHKTDQPISIHRIDDELFRKVYDKLYEENKINRLKIYYDIMNQKRSYIEKAENQFRTIIRENRAKKDKIKSKIRSLSAEVRADSESIESLGILMAKYDRISKQRIAQFEAEINEIKKSIEEETRRDLSELETLLKNVQKEVNEKLTHYANLARIEQQKRDEIQIKQLGELISIREIGSAQLETLRDIHAIAAAQAERNHLFDRSNWNPFNWGYNVRRSMINFGDRITGKDEVTTAKKIHRIE